MVRVANKPFHTNALAFPEDSLYFDMNRSSSGTVKINLVRTLCSEELRRKMGVEKGRGKGKRSSRGGTDGGMDGRMDGYGEEKGTEEKKRRSGKQWRNEEKERRGRKNPVTHLNEEPFLDSKHRTPTRPRQRSTSLVGLIFGDLGCTLRVPGPASRRGLRVWGKGDRGLR